MRADGVAASPAVRLGVGGSGLWGTNGTATTYNENVLVPGVTRRRRGLDDLNGLQSEVGMESLVQGRALAPGRKRL